MNPALVTILRRAARSIGELALGTDPIKDALDTLQEAAAQGRLPAGAKAKLQALLSEAEAKAETPSPTAPPAQAPVHELFQLSVVDKTQVRNGVVTGTIDVQYTIPPGVDYPTAIDLVIASCSRMANRPRPAFNRADLPLYRLESEEGDNPASARVVSYTIDFNSKDLGDSTMDTAKHREYAGARNSHIALVKPQALGAALYYEQTGRDLMKGYWVRAVVSNDPSAPGVTLSTHPQDGVYVCWRGDDRAHVNIVAAFSRN